MRKLSIYSSVRSFKYIVTVIVGAALFSAVLLEKAELDRSVEESFKQKALAEAQRVATRLSNTQRDIYHGIRTIARLPGVRDIPLHIQGQEFEPTARQSVQELYNNLAQTVALSELYIVPVNMQPDEVDTITGKLQEPITTFDRLIVGRHADKEGAHDSTEIAEIEIYEYRMMREQLDRMLLDCPTLDYIQGLAYPFYGGEKTLTCDNSAYSISHPNDEDRSGFVFSTPFYGNDGKLKGCISAVILQRAFQELLPNNNYVLLATNYNYVSGPLRSGDSTQQLNPWALRGVADTALPYSAVVPLVSPDKAGGWALWAGFPETALAESWSTLAGQIFLWVAGSAVGLLVIAILFVFRAHDKKRDALDAYNQKLSQEVQSRTEELQRKHADLQAIFLAANSALIISTDISGEIEMFNDSALDILRVDRNHQTKFSHVTGILQLFDGDNSTSENNSEQCQRLFEELTAHPSKGISYRRVHTLVLDDGEQLSIDLTISPIYQQQDIDGQISGFLFFGVDVSDAIQREKLILEANKAAAEAQAKALKLAEESVQRQRQLEEAMEQIELAEKELRASQQKIEEVTSTIHEAIWSMDAATQSFTYLSDACESIFGFLPSDYVNRPDLLENAIHEDDKLGYFENLDRLGRGQRVDFDFRIIDARGTLKWVRAVASPIEFVGKKAIRFSGSFSDVTQLHETNAALQDSETRVRAILENVADGIVTLDQSGAIQLSNPAMSSLFDYSSSELENAHITELISSANHDCLDMHSPDFMRATLAQVARSGDCELTARRKDGRTFPIEIAFSEFQLADEQFYIAVIRDITERRAQQDFLAQAEKNTAISALAAGVAHEFKNCLGGIVGNATLALDYQDDKSLIQKSLTNIVDISDKANQIALSLLSYAQTGETGDAVASLQSAVSEARALLDDEIRKKHLRLQIDAIEEMSIAIDPVNLVQTLHNVLANAIQASNPESVVQLRGFKQENICIIEIRDNGHGMTPEALKRAFDPFYSNKGVWGDDSSSGQGLGLTSAKNIIEKAGGSIELSSEEGVGTTVEIHLPSSSESVSQKEAVQYQSVEALPGILVHQFSESSLPNVCQLLDQSLIRWSPLRSHEQLADSLKAEVGIVFLDGMVPSKIEFVQMYEQIREERPDIHIVVVVDKTYDYYIAEYVKSADYILQRPVSISAMRRALKLIQLDDIPTARPE